MSDIYATPDADLDAGIDTDKVYPGLRRLPYFLYSLGINVFFSVFVGVVAGFAESALGITTNIMMLVLVAVSVYLIIQRLHNLGSSGWWALAMFVPFLNIWIGIKTLAFPEGYDDHKTLDTTAKVIVGIMVGAMVLGIAGAFLFASSI